MSTPAALLEENAVLRARLAVVEERLGALVQDPGTGVWVWPDVSVDRVYLDPSVRRNLGLDPERGWWTPDEALATVHPGDEGAVRAAVAAAIESGGAYDVTHRVAARDGHGGVEYVHSRGEVIRHPGGRVTIRGANTLVTRERDLLAERDRMLESLERVIAAGGVQLWRWPSLEGGALELNGVLHEAVEDLGDTDVAGAPSDDPDADADPWRALIHPDDRAGFRASLTERVQATGDFEIEARMRFTPEGDYRWQVVRGCAEPREEVRGDFQASGTLFDIEQRRSYQAELERANEKLRLVSAGTNSGIWDWPDMSADVIHISRELQDFMGYADDGIEDSMTWIFSIIHPEDIPHVRADIDAVREEGGAYDSAFRIRMADGSTRHVRSAGVITRDAGGPGVHRLTGAVTDVHARVTAQHELEQANRHLSGFADLVAHDLAAPLRHVTAFAEILREDHRRELSPAARGHLDTIVRAVEQSSAMIVDLLTYARTGTSPLDPEAIDLTSLCEELRAQLSADGQSAHLAWDIGALPIVRADRTQMLTLFQNLLANAVKFTRKRPGARVSVSAGTGTEREHEIVVADNGVGFDPAYGEHIFEAFARAHRGADFPGTGIGLANVARIVARHDGRIRAEGTPGEGATFSLVLPRA